jgi:hypothetical protein
MFFTLQQTLKTEFLIILSSNIMGRWIYSLCPTFFQLIFYNSISYLHSKCWTRSLDILGKPKFPKHFKCNVLNTHFLSAFLTNIRSDRLFEPAGTLNFISVVWYYWSKFKPYFLQNALQIRDAFATYSVGILPIPHTQDPSATWISNWPHGVVTSIPL